MAPRTPKEECPRDDAEKENDSRCAKDPFLVRDEGRHVGEPAFVCCRYHSPTRSRVLRSRGIVIESRPICFALGLAVISR